MRPAPALLLILSMMFASGVASAQSAPTPDKHTALMGARFDSTHFAVYTASANADYAAKLESDLERYFSAFQKEFWDFIRIENRESHIDLLVFDSQEAFDTFAGGDVNAPPGEKGYSSKTANRIACVRQDAYYKDVMIIVHEMAHVFNRFCLDETPVWLDEGLAQYYSNYAGYQCGNPLTVSGVDVPSLRAIDEALRAGTFVKTIELVRLSDDAFYSEFSGLHYAEAWALVYYLRRGTGDDGDERLASCYGLLTRGRTSAEAFTTTYGLDYDSFEHGWLEYLSRLFDEFAASQERVSTDAETETKR